MPSADISLSTSHSSNQTYRREEALLAGFVSVDEGFSDDSVTSGRRITRVQEQSEAFSDEILLDRFKSGENFSRLEDTQTQCMSSLRALQADFSAEAKSVSEATLLPSMVESDAVESIVPSDITLSAKDRAWIELIVTIVEELTGKRIRVTDPEEFLESRTVDTQLDPLTPPPTKAATADVPSEENLPAFTLPYPYQEFYSKSETTTFSAQGQINKYDGTRVSIDISITMSRLFSTKISGTEMGAILKDPLVINSSGTVAESTELTFQFDIGADDTSDQILSVKPGNRFLKLDRNEGGEYDNDGSELSGNQSGNRFADLVAHENDRNGLIDKGHTVFDRLRVFVQDGSGNRQLAALGAKGVEAIYLKYVSTLSEIKNELNDLKGVVRETGLYVGENGEVDTLKQIDLVV